MSRSEIASVIQADELYFQDRAHTGVRGLELSACMGSWIPWQPGVDLRVPVAQAPLTGQ